MGFFDNILQINNSFLLIGLIIVAITCIYLLYTNLTKSGDTTALKTTIMNLIQQNKKRDEIINFLLERIENLEHALPPAGSSSATMPIGDVIGIETADGNGATELDNLLASVQEDNTNDAEEKTALDDLLDEVNNLDADIDPVPLNMANHPELEQPHADSLAEVHVESTDNNINSTLTNPVMLSEFDDLEAEFSGLMGMEIVQESPVHLDNHPDVEIDLVSSILGADDIANMADVDVDLSSIPKDKKRLISKYNTKQLKHIASRMALKTSGSKVDLADRIIAKLSTSDPAVN